MPVRCTPHGLRKRCLNDLAEQGKTIHQITSVSGHLTMEEVDGLDLHLMLVRLERDVAYCCAPKDYEEAITRPEACIEVGFPLRDVKMKEAAN